MLSRRFADDGKRLEQLNEVQVSALERHLSKLAHGPYERAAVPCPVCTVADDCVLAEKDRYGIPLRVVACRTCGLIRTAPRLTAGAFADFYNTEYRPLYGGSAAPDDKFFDAQVAHGADIVQQLESVGFPVGPHLLVVEVGCGAGGILQAFRARQATVIGCDLGDAYVHFGRSRHGLDLRNGTLADLALPRPADVIIYSHVLEHVLDLNSELALIRQKLAPAGLVYVEVPSVKNIHRPYRGDFLGLLQNAHTFHFTERTLLNVFARHDFVAMKSSEDVAAIFTHGKATQFESDFDSVIKFLRRAEYLRHLNFLRPARLRSRLVELLALLGLKPVVKRILRRDLPA